MPRTTFSLGICVVASGLLFATGLGPIGELAVAPAYADDAADALKKCDDLASHPLDGRRYSPPVPDDRFATGAAVDACEAAVKLNPDSARALFELGRSYWLMGGERDKDAFVAFAQAAKRGYPIAFKFIGDAYLEGRGLPSGESRSAQTAIAWYQKAVAAGLAAAQKAIDEVQAEIDRQNLARQRQAADDALKAQQIQDKADREKFDPKIFQNPDIMSDMYYGDYQSISQKYFIVYMDSFISKIGGTEPFFVNGQSCIPQIKGTTSAAIYKLQLNFIQSTLREGVQDALGSGDYQANLIKFGDQGGRDAIALFNRYGCDGEVTRTVIENINLYFDPTRKASNGAGGGSRPRPQEQTPGGNSASGERYAEVATLELKVRSCPEFAKRCAEIDRLKEGDKVKVISGADNGWVQIESHPGMRGFVNGKFLTLE